MYQLIAVLSFIHTDTMSYNKTSLIVKVAEKNSMKQKDAAKIINDFISVLSDAIKSGAPVSIQGFGRFTLKKYTKNGVNPRTQEKRVYNITRVAYKTGADLKK